MKKVFLSNDQEKYVIKNWHRESISTIVNKLGLSKSIISAEAKRFGLKSKSERLKERLEERNDKIDKYLIGHWSHEKLIDLVSRLNEKLWVIEERAKKLGLRKKRTTIVGSKIGRLYIVAKIEKYKYQCRCDCGEMVEVSSDYLYNGKNQACKICRPPPSRPHCWQDLTGQRFGRLTVLKESSRKNKYLTSEWDCLCDCGNVKTIARASLKSGLTRSCGCLQSDMLSGAKSRFWKGGVTTENKLLRSSTKYRKWTLKIKARDNHTCKCCGHVSKGTSDIEVHHILFFSSNIDLRFEDSNAITLCTQCHEEFHDMCKENKNTKNQLIYFIKFKRNYLLKIYGQLPLLPTIAQIFASKIVSLFA